MKMASVTIHGDVKLNESRRGVTIWEHFTQTYKDGVTYERKRKWVVWFENPVSFNDGDWIELKGELTTKVSSYEKDGETKFAVDHSINNPLIIKIQTKQEEPAAKVRDLDDEAKYGNAPF
jgi:hypothetical protein